MPKAPWSDEVWEIHERVVKKWTVGSREDMIFLMMGLAGEAGEAANIMKKTMRGDPDVGEHDLLEELADVRVYMELLLRCMQFTDDIVVSMFAIPKIRARWPASVSEV